MPRPKQNPNCLPALQDSTKPIAIDIKDSREDDFIRNMFLGLSVLDAGMKAGYSHSYCTSAIYQKFNSKAFQDKLRDYAISTNARSVPKVCNLYARAVDHLYAQVERGELDNLAKLKHIPRQVLEIARILQPEGAAGPTLVNIENIQMLVNGKFNGKPDPTSGDSE